MDEWRKSHEHRAHCMQGEHRQGRGQEGLGSWPEQREERNAREDSLSKGRWWLLTELCGIRQQGFFQNLVLLLSQAGLYILIALASASSVVGVTGVYTTTPDSGLLLFLIYSHRILKKSHLILQPLNMSQSWWLTPNTYTKRQKCYCLKLG